MVFFFLGGARVGAWDAKHWGRGSTARREGGRETLRVSSKIGKSGWTPKPVP